MSRMTGVTKAEERYLAVASAMLGPWRPAALVGALGAGVSLVLGAIGPGLGLTVVGGALSTGLTLFFLVGGVGAVLARGAGPDRRITRWGRRHPWHVAAVPASAMFVSDLVVRAALTADGFFGGVWTALWDAAFVWLVIGTVGAVVRRRRGWPAASGAARPGAVGPRGAPAQPRLSTSRTAPRSALVAIAAYARRAAETARSRSTGR